MYFHNNYNIYWVRPLLLVMFLPWSICCCVCQRNFSEIVTVFVCPMLCMHWTEYNITYTSVCPSVRRLWTRMWRYLWTDLHQIWNIASPYHTAVKFFFVCSSIGSSICACAPLNRPSLTAAKLSPTIHVVFAKLSCFCVDYFNKMAELVFATVFDTHMCKKKLTERQKFRRKQTILRRTEKNIIVFARRRTT